jgi:uncharacterized membrane protein YphA (DoxX/SURF4 family)
MNTPAKVLLVLLRVAIGWHFLYEGLFKLDSDAVGTPYLTSRYPLQTATARLRDSLGAPEGLTPAAAEARIDQWHDEIVRHFQNQNNPLGDDQKARLALLRDRLKQQPPAEDLDWYFIHDEVLKVPADKPPSRFTSLEYLQGSTGPFRGFFRGLAPDIDGLKRLSVSAAHARLDERSRQLLQHYRARGYAFDDQQQAALAAARDRLKQSAAAMLASADFQARLTDYETMLRRVRRASSGLTASYSRERLEADRKRLDTIASELLALVNEPLAELTWAAENLARVKQLNAGPPPPPPTQTGLLDSLVKWGLTASGLGLLLGLFTPLAALGAAAQLALFYFASPPWPGLPAALMGGHYLYVDRNLIELVAVLLVAAAGAGRWAGLDFYLRRRVGQAFRLPFSTLRRKAAGGRRPQQGANHATH